MAMHSREDSRPDVNRGDSLPTMAARGRREDSRPDVRRGMRRDNRRDVHNSRRMKESQAKRDRYRRDIRQKIS